MNEWLMALARLQEEHREALLVTIASGSGSTPREAGVKMVVTAEAMFGTIGGGQMEYEALGLARQVLRDRQSPLVRRYALGTDSGQVCGGAANLVFERLPPDAEWVRVLAGHLGNAIPSVLVSVASEDTAGRLIVTANERWGTLGDAALDAAGLEHAQALLANSAAGAQALELRATGDRVVEVLLDRVEPSDFRVVLFGAGHVGRALAHALGILDCDVEWVDSRPEQFPALIPNNVRKVVTDRYAERIAAARPGSFFLTMTHSHAIDFEIVQHTLARDDFAFLGLIGSSTKRRSFENNLVKRGFSREALARIVCPIGIDGLHGKAPGTIAIAVAAQLLGEYERRRARAVASNDAVTR